MVASASALAKRARRGDLVAGDRGAREAAPGLHPGGSCSVRELEQGAIRSRGLARSQPLPGSKAKGWRQHWRRRSGPCINGGRMRTRWRGAREHELQAARTEQTSRWRCELQCWRLVATRALATAAGRSASSGSELGQRGVREEHSSGERGSGSARRTAAGSGVVGARAQGRGSGASSAAGGATSGRRRDVGEHGRLGSGSRNRGGIRRRLAWTTQIWRQGSEI